MAISKGFTVIIGMMEIRAMQRTDEGEVPAQKSSADSYHVYHRGSGRLRSKDREFDTAFERCIARALRRCAWIPLDSEPGPSPGFFIDTRAGGVRPPRLPWLSLPRGVL
ncbi:hypothetical protein ACU4GI_09095 [Cupriavidus basilensis]|nr:hypothetical protein CF70_016860 [Cupriavidus sp. SK-3]